MAEVYQPTTGKTFNVACDFDTHIWKLQDDDGKTIDTDKDACELCKRNSLRCSFVDEEYGGPRCDILS